MIEFFNKLKAHYEDHRSTYEIDDILFILKHVRKNPVYTEAEQKVKQQLLMDIGYDLSTKYAMSLDDADRMLFLIEDKPLNFNDVGIEMIDNPNENGSKYYSLYNILKRYNIINS